MKSIARWISVALPATFFLAACDRTPTGADTVAPMKTQASATVGRTVQESLYDLTGIDTYFGCSPDGEPLENIEDGERVSLYGKVYERFTTLVDAMGGHHTTQQTMPVGVGATGHESGEDFRLFEREQAAYNQTMEGLTGSWRSEFRLVGRETGRTFWVVFGGNYRLAADGEVIVDRYIESVSCKPAVRN